MKYTLPLILFVLAPLVSLAEKPNIVLVITDDQGYGDLAHNGNPHVKTPAIDKLHSESVALDDYHVAPTCSPTRCGLLTGHWTNRTGVWHTVNGRSMLRENEITIATLLKNNGYTTGLFGKWHLGDNYPYRPEDRGFDEVFRHGGGGVGQTPDLWNNNYFGGSYFHNGKIVDAEGFCTDVFFDQGIDFIRKSAEAKKPFFAYISTNAPHGPLHCPPKYMEMYKGMDKKYQAFYGMITNIDDNVARTRKVLEELGIADNTIFIFTTDNGTAYGQGIYNAGMKGSKGSAYEGGHRVPFIIRWPAGGLHSKKSVKTLTGFVDVVPTLLDLCGADKIPAALKFDGVSIRKLLYEADSAEWPDRFLITDSQRVRDPIKWKDSSVMSERWRLINGKELYEIDDDPGQKNNVATQHPEQVETMRKFYESWWTELEPTFSQTTEIYLGDDKAPKVTLTGHDWIQEQLPPWNQGMIRVGNDGNKGKKHEGYWAVKVVKSGSYKLELRRWPSEADAPITASLPAKPNVPGASKAFSNNKGKAFPFTKATLRIDGKDVATKDIDKDATHVTFTVDLTEGSHQLAPVFKTANGNETGAYYLIVSSAP
ncbi:arylsulfatase [Haloferula sp.]|uniref:arylsulfatase n=1 Tax=Haloferula sp. TaxID=2497595 RepID=UPI003C710677